MLLKNNANEPNHLFVFVNMLNWPAINAINKNVGGKYLKCGSIGDIFVDFSYLQPRYEIQPRSTLDRAVSWLIKF